MATVVKLIFCLTIFATPALGESDCLDPKAEIPSFIKAPAVSYSGPFIFVRIALKISPYFVVNVNPSSHDLNSDLLGRRRFKRGERAKMAG